jgi:hypothetical protein
MDSTIQEIFQWSSSVNLGLRKPHVLYKNVCECRYKVYASSSKLPLMEFAATFEIQIMCPRGRRKNGERLDNRNAKNKHFPRESIPLMVHNVER